MEDDGGRQMQDREPQKNLRSPDSGSKKPAGTSRRSDSKRLIIGTSVFVIVSMVIAGAMTGYLWWIRPWTRSAPLPPGVEQAETVKIGNTIQPLYTNQGRLEWDSLRVENHEWVATVNWRQDNVGNNPIDFHLGQTHHIQGLGTITLIEIDPAYVGIEKWVGAQKGGGSRAFFNVQLDSEVERIYY